MVQWMTEYQTSLVLETADFSSDFGTDMVPFVRIPNLLA